MSVTDKLLGNAESYAASYDKASLRGCPEFRRTSAAARC